MDVKKTWITMLIFLAVVGIAWAGFSVYAAVSKKDIDPNVPTYIKYLAPKFDTDTFDKLTKRIEDLPISTTTFKSLNSTN